MTLTTVFLDLDGTLLDVSERYWQLHRDLTMELGLPELDRDTFWDMKRNRATYDALSGSVSPDVTARYRTEWVAYIEAVRYLNFDRPFDATLAVLRELNQHYRVVLATMRANREQLEDQLDKLGLAPELSLILRDDSGSADQGDKVALLTSDPANGTDHGVMIGDTEVDIRAARDLGMHSVGMTTGLRTRALLADLQPGALLDDTAEIPRAVRTLLSL